MYKNRKAIKALLIFYVIILAIMLVKAPSFFSVDNAMDILLNVSTTAIAALGMLCVLLVGDIDVSVGAILAACCTTTGLVDQYVKEVMIKTKNPSNPASSLSGGNMQKVVIGKCLATNPKVLLLNNPTRGIDISARQEIYSLIRGLANEGMSIIMLTEDLLELLGMSDRILITRNKEISKIFDENNGLTEEDVISYIV